MRPLTAGIASLLWGVPLIYPLLSINWSAHDFSRLAQVIVLTLIVLVVAWQTAFHRHGTESPKARIARRMPRWRLAASLLLMLCVLTSLVRSAQPAAALRELLLLSGLALFSQWLGQMLRATDAAQSVLRALSAAALVHGLLTLLLIAMSVHAGQASDPTAAILGFDNPRFLNHVQTVSLPLVAVVSSGDESARWRRLGWWCLVISGMLLFVTWGRATLLALTVGMLTAWWAFGRACVPYVKRTAVPTVIGMLGMWACYLVWMKDAGYVIDVEQFTQAHYRDYLLHQAWKLWSSHPWFGVGPMHFAHWNNNVAAHPHNIYAQVLAEFGLPATVIVLTLVARWMFRTLLALRKVPTPQITLAIGLWGALIGIAIDGAFSGNFVMPMSQIWIAFALGLINTVISPPPTNTEDASPSTRANGLVRHAWRQNAMVSVLAVGLLWLSVQSLREALVSSDPIIDTPGPIDGMAGKAARKNPRYWNVGLF